MVDGADFTGIGMFGALSSSRAPFRFISRRYGGCGALD